MGLFKQIKEFLIILFRPIKRVPRYITGINSKGEEVRFNTFLNWVSAIRSDLVRLDLPYGIEQVTCFDNKLTELKIPESVKWISCDKELFDYDTCKTHYVVIVYE